ncbi:twin transmembrane helix small protein [uncultured Rhodoblastus sp.]|uniref:twin transmembrane helix small protein n=1 Tax=uncultured Rhodoblastus sp. TaxID=543037 RepID=UPI0025FA9025|nr:twin transmembrane helix small protein [uncultured Rhodoblastus sp.]
MSHFFDYLVVAALLGVALALFLGLANMLRGGAPNLSQKLMRWRVGLQFLAILAIVGALFMRK